MANKTIKTRIQLKRELEADWKNSSLVPLKGELIVYLKEIDPETGNVCKLPEGRSVPYTYDRFKLGDGYNNVNDLDFIITGSSEAPEQPQTIITSGSADPTDTTEGQYYFKYSL